MIKNPIQQKKQSNQNIGKTNYDSNFTLNHEIQSALDEYYSIFKEKLLQLLENFFHLQIKEKFKQRQSLILEMKQNIFNYEVDINEKLKPAYIMSDNSIESIKNLYTSLSRFKILSDRIKNLVNFNNFEKNIKVIFHNVFELMEEIHEILYFYMKVYQNLNLENQKSFYDKISNLFNDFEDQINLILVTNDLEK